MRSTTQRTTEGFLVDNVRNATTFRRRLHWRLMLLAHRLDRPGYPFYVRAIDRLAGVVGL